MNLTRVIFLADYQMPYHDPRAVDIAHQYIYDAQPDLVVVGGDLVDFTNLSTKFLRSDANRRSILYEIDMARAELEELSRLTGPKCQRVFVGGNHEQRLRTYIQALAPELEPLMDEELSFDTLFGLRDAGFQPYIEYPGIFEYKGFVFKHGDFVGASAGQRELRREGSSGMSGHLHQYRVYAETNRQGSHAWFHSPCLAYTRGASMPPGKHQGVQDWTQGFMEILFYESEGERRLFQVNPIIVTEGRTVTPAGNLLVGGRP